MPKLRISVIPWLLQKFPKFADGLKDFASKAAEAPATAAAAAACAATATAFAPFVVPASVVVAIIAEEVKEHIEKRPEPEALGKLFLESVSNTLAWYLPTIEHDKASTESVNDFIDLLKSAHHNGRWQQLLDAELLEKQAADLTIDLSREESLWPLYREMFARWNGLLRSLNTLAFDPAPMPLAWSPTLEDQLAIDFSKRLHQEFTQQLNSGKHEKARRHIESLKLDSIIEALAKELGLSQKILATVERTEQKVDALPDVIAARLLSLLDPQRNQLQTQLDAKEAEVLTLRQELERLKATSAAQGGPSAASLEQAAQSALSLAINPHLQPLLENFLEAPAGARRPILDAIIAAQDAERAQDNLRHAERLRERAFLMATLSDQGEVPFEELISVWEQAQQLDPACHWGWIELSRIYQGHGGNIPSARFAAKQALANAFTNRERSVAYDSLGDVLLESGDLICALRCYEQSLIIAKQLAEDDPNSEDSQRDVSVSLNKVAYVLLQSGDLSGALDRYEKSLEIREMLYQSNPANTEANRDVSVSLNCVGDVKVRSGDLVCALKCYKRSLEIRRQLEQSNPTSTRAQRDVGVSLDNVGTVLFHSGEFAAAIEYYEQSYAIMAKLARFNPASADAKRGLSVSLDKVAEVLRKSGDLTGALVRYNESLSISKELALSKPTSAAAQRDLMVSYANLARLTNTKPAWQKVLDILERLHAEGRLAPADHELIAQARDAYNAAS